MFRLEQEKILEQLFDEDESYSEHAVYAEKLQNVNNLNYQYAAAPALAVALLLSSVLFD